MSKVSVIIPCYNVEKYVSDCLDSVLKQTFQDYEVICIEDCSTDSTPDILKKYEDKHKIRILYNETNRGLAESRNIGMNHAKGDYIYFLDSDDTISPQCLEILYNKISNDNSDIVMGTIHAYPQNPKDLFCVDHSKCLNEWLIFSAFEKQQINQKNVLDFYNKLHCCAVNKLYKKSFLLDNGICFIHRKCFHEDNGFWFKILACNPTISGIKERTYLYRVRNNSISDKMDSDKKEHIQNLKQSLKDALVFVKQKKNKILSDFVYSEIHRLKKYRLISFIWLNNEKHLKILFIPIFRIKFNYKKRQGTFKILGIPVYRWRKNDT